MKRMFALLTTSMAILALLVPLVLAQEPSPALGGYLDLNGIDSFAICPDNDSLDKDLGDFSIEVWIYPRSKPKKDEQWIFATKPGRYELALIGPHESKDPFFNIRDFAINFKAYTNEAGTSYYQMTAFKERPGGEFPDDFKFNEWYYIIVRVS